MSGFEPIQHSTFRIQNSLPASGIKPIQHSTFRIKNSLPGYFIMFLLAFGTIFIGCTHGLEPLPLQSGFGGTVRFISAWPPADSVVDLRVVAFYKYPPSNIFGEVINGQAKVYPAIGPGTSLKLPLDSVAYTFTLDSASTFQYVVVALQYGSNITTDWKVVGAYGYSHGAGSPKSVIVPDNSFINGIDIDVDFKNVPPTPNVSGAIVYRVGEHVAVASGGRSQIR